ALASLGCFDAEAVLRLAGARAAAARRRLGAVCSSPWSVMVGNSPAFSTASIGSTGSPERSCCTGLVTSFWLSSIATSSRALSQWTSDRPSGQPSSTHRREARCRTRSSKFSICWLLCLLPVPFTRWITTDCCAAGFRRKTPGSTCRRGLRSRLHRPPGSCLTYRRGAQNGNRQRVEKLRDRDVGLSPVPPCHKCVTNG